ncbi:hypothetical protein C2G38_2136435 [Gigaspora rosea]|uniref:Uncharacterized protein n=1 Tax=Gigaspora rosea TaxID=44941 RepID=A0A397WD63_9GLOM|nr:hypothetical protein C2G38_2136435 [Gigaspora rosea]
MGKVGLGICSQVDHSVIPHHNASDISATVDGPFSFDAGHFYLPVVVKVMSFTNIHFSPNKDESISNAVKKFWQDVEDTDRREKIGRKKASINLLNGLEESTYDILDATRTSVVENVKAENKKHYVIQENAVNNPFLVSSKRVKLGSESPSNRRDSSSSASSHAKSDSEPLSDGNDSLSRHTKSDNKPPSDRSNSSFSASAKSDSKPPSDMTDSSLKSDGSDSTWKPNESEDDETEDEDDKKKKLESKLFGL